MTLDLFYFHFQDGKKSELMDEATAKLFKRELDRAGVEVELKSATMSGFYKARFEMIEKQLAQLTQENYDLSKAYANLKLKVDGHMTDKYNQHLLLHVKETESLKKLKLRVNNHINILRQNCPHTTY